jgi:hypothetical protein
MNNEVLKQIIDMDSDGLLEDNLNPQEREIADAFSSFIIKHFDLEKV